ncbi:MAG: hypothetical protein HQK66_00545 [Desulfamplus sp.]|nr:hypothetical protein [Desulfamplus sp.]
MEKIPESTLTDTPTFHIDGKEKILQNSDKIFLGEFLNKKLWEFMEQDTLLSLFRLFPAVRIHEGDVSVIYICYIPLPKPGDGTKSPMDAENPWIKSEESLSAIQDDRLVLSDAFDLRILIPVRHNSRLANSIMFLYMGISFMLFLFFYKRSIMQDEKEENLRVEEIRKLKDDEQEYLDNLSDLKKQRTFLAEQLKEAKTSLQEEARKATIAENELFEEIARLEKELESNQGDQQRKELEIENLKDQLERLERRKTGTKKRKYADVLEKRMATIYKNVDMNRRAISGMMDLNEDMQIKAEELIYQLNIDPSSVIVKRKVFAGKKNKTASFEVLFSYNGRLYFTNVEGRVEVLVIGTKNSQDKDMEFLHDL